MTSLNADKIKLPSGNYRIIGIAGKLNECECENIIPNSYSMDVKCWDDHEKSDNVFSTAVSSFLSLLRSKNIPLSSLVLEIL